MPKLGSFTNTPWSPPGVVKIMQWDAADRVKSSPRLRACKEVAAKLSLFSKKSCSGLQPSSCLSSCCLPDSYVSYLINNDTE